MLSNLLKKNCLSHLCAAALLLCLIAFQFLSDFQSQNYLLLALFACANLLHFAAVLYSKEISFRAVLVWAFILRAACFIPFNSAELISGDLYRYLWEGKVLLEGLSPYELSPNDLTGSSLALENQELFDKVEHKSHSAIYQPVSLIFFAASLGEVLNWRIICQIVEILCMLIVFLWAKEKSLEPRVFAIYAWLPLLFFEISYGAHVDVIQMFFITGGIYLYEVRKREALAVVVLTLGFLTKFLAIVPLSYIFFRVLSKRRFDLLALFLLVCGAFYFPFFYLGEGLTGGVLKSVFAYASNWQFNGVVFDSLLSFGFDKTSLKTFLAGVFFIIWLFALSKPRASLAVLTANLYCFLLVVSSTVYPWYLLCFAPLMIFDKNLPSILPKLWFCYGVLFSYEVLAHPANWSVPVSIYLLEYLPLVTLLAFSFLNRPQISTSEQ